MTSARVESPISIYDVVTDGANVLARVAGFMVLPTGGGSVMLIGRNPDLDIAISLTLTRQQIGQIALVALADTEGTAE